MTVKVRRDFARVAEFLVFDGQKKNLQELHDWLIYELNMPASEIVVALTNYQEGNPFRLPSHILVVTTERVAFTHGGGMRTIPHGQVDLERSTADIGDVHGDLVLALTDGEIYRFKRGEAAPMRQVESAIVALQVTPNQEAIPRSEVLSRIYEASGLGPPSSGLPVAASHSLTTANVRVGRVAEPQVPESSKGSGDHLFEFDRVVTGPSMVQVLGGGFGETLRIIEIGPEGEHGQVLVDAKGVYQGVLVIGLHGHVKSLEIETTGPWEVSMVSMDAISALDEGMCVGRGDGVVLARRDLQALPVATDVTFRIDSRAGVSLVAHGRTTKVLLEDRGSFKGSISAPSGTGFLVIRASDNWGIVTST